MEDYESGRHSTLRFIRNILLHYYDNSCMVHPHIGQVSSMVLITENETVLTTKFTLYFVWSTQPVDKK